MIRIKIEKEEIVEAMEMFKTLREGLYEAMEIVGMKKKEIEIMLRREYPHLDFNAGIRYNNATQELILSEDKHEQTEKTDKPDGPIQ